LLGLIGASQEVEGHILRAVGVNPNSSDLYLNPFRQAFGSFRVDVAKANPIVRYFMTAGFITPLDSSVQCRMMVGDDFGRTLNATCNAITLWWDRHMALSTGADFGSSVQGVVRASKLDGLHSRQGWATSLAFARTFNDWVSQFGLKVIYEQRGMQLLPSSDLLRPGVCMQRLPISLWERIFHAPYGATVVGDGVPGLIDHDYANEEKHYIHVRDNTAYVSEGEIRGVWLDSVKVSVSGAGFERANYVSIPNAYDRICVRNSHVYTHATIPLSSGMRNFRDYRFYLEFWEDPVPRVLRCHREVQHPRGVLDAESRTAVDGVNLDFVSTMQSGFTTA
jgi:hypothetical protein